MKQVIAKFIPEPLNFQRELYHVTNGDETLVYDYNIETKTQLTHWKSRSIAVKCENH